MEVTDMIVHGVYLKGTLYALGFIVFSMVLDNVTTTALKNYK